MRRQKGKRGLFLPTKPSPPTKWCCDRPISTVLQPQSTRLKLHPEPFSYQPAAFFVLRRLAVVLLTLCAQGFFGPRKLRLTYRAMASLFPSRPKCEERVEITFKILFPLCITQQCSGEKEVKLILDSGVESPRPQLASQWSLFLSKQLELATKPGLESHSLLSLANP